MSNRTNDWARRAACVGVGHAAFDATEGPGALEALTYCALCPVTDECLRALRPEYCAYDGTVGGRVWRRGRDITDKILQAEGVAA